MIRVGVTIGDINGIGPETIMKAFSDNRLLEGITPIIYGSGHIITYMKKNLDMNNFNFQGIKSAEEAHNKKVNVLNLFDDNVEPDFGKPTKEAGAVAWESLKTAVADLASNKIDVLVTAPINKDTIQSDEFNFPGHTEYLAEMSNVEDFLMLLVSNDLRVGVVTGHIPLKEVSEALTVEKIVSKVQLLNDSLEKDFAIRKPRIAVMGLNPHAGDNGLLGDEEKNIIIPAIRQCTDMGILTFGPFGADGFFGSPAFKQYDGVVAMYHDQGLAPFKALAFETGVNYTAGLPIVRTSPDHGTGYDIAGKDMASADSLRNAVYTAVDVYNNRRDHKEMTANPLEPQPRKKGKDTDN